MDQKIGQKLITLVRTRIPAKTSNTIARIPVITFVKNKTTINAANKILTTLSIEPTFFFIFVIFLLLIENKTTLF